MEMENVPVASIETKEMYDDPIKDKHIDCGWYKVSFLKQII